MHRDTQSFNNALRSALREDPDIILVGEMRDLETIRLALISSGNWAFSPLVRYIQPQRQKLLIVLLMYFLPAEKDMIRSMLSESLQAVISQTLLKKIGGGRVAAHEIMVGTSAIRNLIREAKVAQMYSAIQTGRKEGMITLDQNLKELVDKGLITTKSAMAKAVSQEYL